MRRDLGAPGRAPAPIATTGTPIAAVSTGCQAMSKRAKTTALEAQTTMVGSAAVQLRVDYELASQVPIGYAVYSDVVSVGEHLWRIECLPRGDVEDGNGEYISIFLRHMSKSTSVTAIFEAFLIDTYGIPSMTETRRILRTFRIATDRGRGSGDSWGWRQFVKRTILEEGYVDEESHFTFVCAIMIIDDCPICVPPSDITTHLGRLLDDTDATDVSFVIDGETFTAHRAVLAARSSVFRAELFGSMAEATMSSITLQDITPAAFKAMLRFMYTDALPGESELGESPVEMFQDLLAAADRYALDRLKSMCSRKLWDKVSVETVATTLACAETYNCPELKNKCFDFLAVEKNFKEAVFTDGYAWLVLKFPLVTAELKERMQGMED